ncbi:copper resistance protein NlpE [Hymenobacter guriensis]|uniref:Copper resistance protein NlpE N-terminal domain-containing protein n=1 Tax=Hymenobacter guriensis TaxID=2793065 RepID=A0ABS0KZN7_9BACT|nr:copper resistance protein NlpE [Hymenobacter guriensis]MBG8553328.1 copper resistance protein NlpE N-terminal domain-containing protein [Hymenobacter guriensis]
MPRSSTSAAVAALLLFAACQGRENPYGTGPENPAAEKEAPPVAQRLAGTYTDTIPCADCRGILTNLQLNADSTYVLRETYLDKQPAPTAQRGNWRLRGQVLTLPPSGTHPGRSYLVETSSQLLLLDGSGKPIRDANLDYSLERQ